jgi:hypothetical protein
MWQGYIKPRNRGEVVDSEDRVISCQFKWSGVVKPVTTLFIGSSPEFELALYTIMFLAGRYEQAAVPHGSVSQLIIGTADTGNPARGFKLVALILESLHDDI